MSSKEISDAPPDLSALQETFDHQQAKITALKKLVRQSEAAQGQKTAIAQEKVKNIAQRLTHLKSKTFRLKKGDKQINEIKEEVIDHTEQDADTDISINKAAQGKARPETPGAEKIQLLRKEMEENRQKIAEREHSKRDIEELVTQLKAKFDSNQLAIEKSSQLGRSVDDLSSVKSPMSLCKFQSANDLSYSIGHTTVNRERIKFLEKRLSDVETEMKIKEQEFLHKDPKSEQLKIIKELEGKILDFEESIKEKESIIAARTQAVSLLSENMSMKGKNTVDLLEETKQEMVEMQKKFVETETMYQEEIDTLRNELDAKDCRIAELNEINDILETARFDLTCTTSALKTRIGDLEEECKKLSDLNADFVKKISGADENKKSDETTIADNDDVQQKIIALELSLQEYTKKLSTQAAMIEKLEGDLLEKNVEYNVLNANFSVLQDKLKTMPPKSIFSTLSTEEANAEITKLKEQLDQANKSAIKNKLKINQLQKQLKQANKIELVKDQEKDSYKTDEHTAVSALTLSSDEPTSSAIEMLSVIKDDEARRVSGHIETIELEEKVEILTKTCAELRQEIIELNAKKADLNSRLNHYITENMELLDKLEKLSKGSSAESIEMVENLTQQEKLEMDKLQMLAMHTSTVRAAEQEDEEVFIVPPVEVDNENNVAMSQDLSESLIKLREDSSMLMEKIEMFTNERREVMDKMEDLNIENLEYVKKLEDAQQFHDQLSIDYDALKAEKLQLESQLGKITNERDELQQNLKKLTANRIQLQEEINILTRTKNTTKQPITYFDIPDTPILTTTPELCTAALATLDTELENYRKGKDKTTMMKISIKLAKEARNIHTLMKKLLEDLEISVAHAQMLESQLNAIKEKQQDDNVPSSPPLSDDFVVLPEYVKDAATNESIGFDESVSKHSDKSKIDFIETSVQTEPVVTVEMIDKSISPAYDFEEKHKIELNKIRMELENRLNVCGNEIEILKTLVAEQKEQLISTLMEHEHEMNVKNSEIMEYEKRVNSLTTEMQTAQSEISLAQEKHIFILENDLKNAKTVLNDNNQLLERTMNEIAHKQETIDTLNAQIIEMYKTMEETTNQLTLKENDIETLQLLMEKNSNEIIKLREKCDNYEQAIDECNDEITQYSQEIKTLEIKLHKQQENSMDLNRKTEMMEKLLNQNSEKTNELMANLNEERQKNQQLHQKSNNENHTILIEKLTNDLAKLDERNREQLEKLKKFAANLKKKNIQCRELEDQIAQLTKQLLELQNTNVQHEQIQQKTIETQEKLLNATIADLRTNLVSCQNENKNLIEWQRSHSDLLVSKDAIIANLHSSIENKNIEINDLEARSQKLNVTRSEYDGIVEELNSKTIKLEKCKTIIKGKNQTIKTLNDQLNSMQNQSSIIDKNELTALHNELAELNQLNETLKLSYEIKMQENQHFHETLQSDNDQLKEKIIKLEMDIRNSEECRATLEQQCQILIDQLQNQTIESDQNESDLIKQLDSLTKHDQLIEQKLSEAIENKEKTMANLEDVQEEKNQLRKRNSLLEAQIEELREHKLLEMHAEQTLLQQQNNFLQSEMTRRNSEFEQKLTQKNNEVVELEDNLVTQMNSLENERRSIQENLQICQDEKRELQDAFNRYRETASIDRNELERNLALVMGEVEQLNLTQNELQELRIKIVHDQTEIDNLKVHCQNVTHAHDVETSALRQQIGELESMRNQIGQNQTDDQIFIQNENERLQALLTAKELEIQNYQRENLQLKMSAMPATAVDPFAVAMSIGGGRTLVENSSAANNESVISDLRTELSVAMEQQTTLQNQLTAAEEKIQQFNTDRAAIEDDIHHVRDQNRDLQSHLAGKLTTIEDLDSKLQKSTDELNGVKSANDIFKNEQVHLNEQLQKITAQCEQKIDELQRMQIEFQCAHDNLTKYQNDISIKQELIDKLSNDFKQLFDHHELAKMQLQQNAQQTLNLESALQMANQECVHLQEKLELNNRTFIESNGQFMDQINQLENEISLKNQEIVRLEEYQKIHTQETIIDEPIQVVKTTQNMTEIIPLTTTTAVETIAEIQNKIKQHEATISAMDNYISQLQLQLRISTADCEQQVHTIHSLETEIQKRTDNFEKQINQLRVDDSNVEKIDSIIPVQGNPLPDVTIPSKQEPLSSTTASIIPSFDSSIFFGTTAAIGDQITNSLFDQQFVSDQCTVATDETDQVYQGQPVVEEIIVAKKAYLCHDTTELDDEKHVTNSDKIASVTDDDGWGFGADEVALEEQYQKTIAPKETPILVPLHMEFEVKRQELEDKIHELTVERDKIHDESIGLKATITKLLKKLKEYKVKNDELHSTRLDRKSSSIESTDLDLAIQEELNSQVKMLETKLKELKCDFEKENMEKQSLLKRVDVLIAANDRLTEMKEKQDGQMNLAKINIQELTYKLKQLSEWDTEKPESVVINEEVRKIQGLLNEERNHNRVLEDRIRKLQNSLVTKNDAEQDLTVAEEKLHELAIENENYERDILAKNLIIKQLESEVQRLKDETEQLLSTVDGLTIESKNIKSSLDTLMADHHQKINENHSLSEKLQRLNNRNVELSAEVEHMKKQTHLFATNTLDRSNNGTIQELEKSIQDLMAKVQYKDAEIVHLNHKFLDTIKDIEVEKSLIDDHLMTIKLLQNENQNLKNQLVYNNRYLNTSSENIDEELNKSNAVLQRKICELEDDKQQMEHELSVLNDQVLKSLSMEDQMKATILEIDMKNSEITELRHSLELLKQHQHGINTAELIQTTDFEAKIALINRQWEDVLEQRCSELADSWRQHLASKDIEFNEIESRLQQEIYDLKNQFSIEHHQQNEKCLNVHEIENSNNYQIKNDELINDLQEKLSKQDEEITSLKQQLALRSAEYARALTQLDPYGQRTTPSSMLTLTSRTPETVRKSEHDLTMYMLYQRDMRCEELTEELVRILEERDLLQLKLSNSIRQIEEMNRQLGATSPSTTNIDPTNIPTDKLSQIQRSSIDQSTRTKKLREEREHSQRQMALLQQDLATLPPEAVAELMGDYTAVQQQSTQPQSNSSSILLNWLWGNKSPGTN